MRGRLVIAVGFTLIAAAVAMGQTTTKWVERTKADVRAGKASFYDVVDTVLKGQQVTILKTETSEEIYELKTMLFDPPLIREEDDKEKKERDKKKRGGV